MPKPALASKTVRSSAWSMLVGVGMTAISTLTIPDNLQKINSTAKIWGLEQHAKTLMAVGGLLTTFLGAKSIKGRHQVRGEDAIYTPDWLPVGRNLSDLVGSVGIGDVLTGAKEIKDITGAKDNGERLAEISDAIIKLNQRFDRIERGATADTPYLVQEDDEPTLGGY